MSRKQFIVENLVPAQGEVIGAPTERKGRPDQFTQRPGGVNQQGIRILYQASAACAGRSAPCACDNKFPKINGFGDLYKSKA